MLMNLLLVWCFLKFYIHFGKLQKFYENVVLLSNVSVIIVSVSVFPLKDVIFV